MITKERNKILLKDKIVNILFTSKDTIRYVEAIVSAALNIPLEEVQGNLVLQTPRVNKNINTQYSMADAVYETNDIIVNIEVNYVNYPELDLKNLKYVFHLLLDQMKPNQKLNNIKPVYQININDFDIYKKGKFIYTSHIVEDEYNLRRNDYINILDINVDFLRNVDYNLVKEGKKYSLENLLYILICDDKRKRDELYLGNEIMKEVDKKISALTEDFANELYYDRDEIINHYSYDLGREDGLVDGEAKGIVKGIAEGIAKEKISTAKELLKMNMSIEDILRVTKLSKEELDSIISEVQDLEEK